MGNFLGLPVPRSKVSRNALAFSQYACYNASRQPNDPQALGMPVRQQPLL